MSRISKRPERRRRAPHELTDEERVDIAEALAEARRGEFATDAEVAAVLARRAG